MPSLKHVTLGVCLGLAGLASPSPSEAASIRGVVTFSGAIDAKKLPVTIDQYVCGKEKVSEELVVSPQRGVRNAVVWLQTPPPGASWDTAPARPDKVEMDQKGCVFVPRVVLVRAGGTVEFLNSDRLLHNLHSASKENPTFNRTQPRGRAIPIAFARPEIVRVNCDLHSWMQAWVVVADHPFYAVRELVMAYEGTLERFTGDGMMIFFNDPMEVANPVERALRMTVAMRSAMEDLAERWRKRGHELHAGMGIAQGYATIGTIGFEGRLDYGAIGSVTNLAFRLCAEAPPGQILISQRVHAEAGDLVDADPVGDLHLKGFQRPVPAYTVRGMKA